MEQVSSGWSSAADSQWLANDGGRAVILCIGEKKLSVLTKTGDGSMYEVKSEYDSRSEVRDWRMQQIQGAVLLYLSVRGRFNSSMIRT